MSFVSTLGRVGLGVATGGASEAVRYAANTDVGKRIGQSLGLSKPDVATIPTPDTAALDAEGQRARDAYQLFLQQAQQQNYQPQQIQASHVVSAGDVQMRDPGAAQRYSASTIAAPDKVAVTGLSPQAQGATAKTVDPSNAAAATATATQVNDTQGQEIRGQQVAYLNALGQAAAGNAPSAADAQFAKGLGDTVTTQMGAVGQARGSDRAAQRREAILAIGKQGQEAALSAAQLKATETSTARGQLGSALSDVRGTDTGVALTDAQLRQQADQLNANNRTSISQFNAGQNNTVAAANADRGLAAQEFTSGQQNTRDVTGAQMRLEADTGNVTRGVDADKYNAGATTAANKDNTAGANAREEYRSTLAGNISTGNVNRQQGINDKNADLTQDAAKSNQNAGLQGQQINNQAAGALRSDALTASGQSINTVAHGTDLKAGVAAQNVVNENNANQAGLDRLKGTIVAGASAIATGGASLATSIPKAASVATAPKDDPNDPDGTLPLRTSDKRAKTNIKRESDKDISDFLNALEAYSYRYKNPADGSGDKVGVMAQDLEKSKIGRTVVRNDNGKKVVDTGALTMAMAGVLSRVAKDARRAGGRK